jgi:hypothetical protein
VNCIQAQALLAAYRELRDSKADTTDLEVHLENCASCRQALANYSLIGERIRSLPAIAPPPDAHAKLMNALATEHIRYMQQAIPGTHRTPEFLKPYIEEQARHKRATDPLVAFSTAETGPLAPIHNHTSHKRQRRRYVGQFAVIGMAAAFLMVVMMSGITTLLVLSQGNPRGAVSGNNTSSITQPVGVRRIPYTTITPYQNIVSAVADRTDIYYTAYGDKTNEGWMLEQLDRKTRKSTPLLATDSTSPLILLGSSNDWLVWLQFHPPKSKNNARSLTNHEPLLLTRTWSLHYLSLLAPGKPLTLTSGTFNQGTSPSWVYTPVQGIWFIQNTLLVATIDENGISHLSSYQLDTTGRPTPTEIATASPDHIFTSPTSTSDGTEIYWSDEWRSDDGILHGNIWMQLVSQVPNPSHGPWAQYPPTVTVKQPFLSDGASFHPQVVDDRLFLLRTAPYPLATTQGTPDASPGNTPTATATPTSIPNTPTTSWADSSIYAVSSDAQIRGMLFMVPLYDPNNPLPTQVNTTGQAWEPQAGTDFVLWQSDNGYEMYDVNTGTVQVGHVLDGARFLAVNESTTVWTIDDPTSATNNANLTATLLVFNWPR